MGHVATGRLRRALRMAGLAVRLDEPIHVVVHPLDIRPMPTLRVVANEDGLSKRDPVSDRVRRCQSSRGLRVAALSPGPQHLRPAL